MCQMKSMQKMATLDPHYLPRCIAKSYLLQTYRLPTTKYHLFLLCITQITPFTTYCKLEVNTWSNEHWAECSTYSCSWYFSPFGSDHGSDNGIHHLESSQLSLWTSRNPWSCQRHQTFKKENQLCHLNEKSFFMLSSEDSQYEEVLKNLYLNENQISVPHTRV